MSSNAHGSISEFDAMGMAGGNRHDEGEKSQYEYDNSNPD